MNAISRRAAGRLGGRIAIGLAAILALGAFIDLPWFGGKDKGKSTKGEKPIHVVIGLDLSQSNPLVKSQPYAEKVAMRIEGEIKDAPFASRITLRSFGTYNTLAETMRYDRQVSRYVPAEVVAGKVRADIAAVPARVKAGELRAQGTTNILAFLDNMAQIVDCKAEKTTVILVSDGIEDSEYAKLVKEGATLPEAPADLFKRCESLQILGLGQGQKSPEVTNRTRAEWEKWAEGAGFKAFVGLNDW